MPGGRIYTDVVTLGDIDIFKVTSNPDGVLTARKGSLAFLTTGPATSTSWLNIDGATGWRDMTAARGPILQGSSVISTTLPYPPTGPGVDAFGGAAIPIVEDGDYFINFESCYFVSGAIAGGTVYSAFFVGLIVNGVTIPISFSSGRPWASFEDRLAATPGVAVGNATFTTRRSFNAGDTVSIAFGWPTVQGPTILNAAMIPRQLSLIKVQ
jgi:hypothetical protein